MSGGVQFKDGHVHLGVVLGPSAVGACILEGESASLGGFGGIACKGEGGRGCESGRLNLNV
jgi:hypothetical protein